MNATAKQKKLVEWMCKELGVEPPLEDSIGSYSKFISDNKKAFDNALTDKRGRGDDRDNSVYGDCDALEEYF